MMAGSDSKYYLDGDSSKSVTSGYCCKVSVAFVGIPCLVLLSFLALPGMIQSSGADESTSLIGLVSPVRQSHPAMVTALRMRNPSQGFHPDPRSNPMSMEQRLGSLRVPLHLIIMSGLRPQPEEKIFTLGKKISDTDMDSVPGDVSALQVGNVAAIKRSDGSWRYARVTKKAEDQLDFDVDGTGSIKQFPKDTWSGIKVLGGPPGASGLGEDAVRGYTR
eukprot:gnl/TRDRNA2_/TRDRNA2_84391_c0_seq2.p1 gnl/TRDRNA2_/TRDRNA2_84391_c0~~gnl/TRDRNA2_/TRDRNA2_84391_c0_seq2.p1  ORF type:complete len:219 (-),score=32.95 gnl/TRDRNA2_/TRDRNA2_84391_c0_seq2:627-1283(-)